jgi:hypothetical protein
LKWKCEDKNNQTEVDIFNKFFIDTYLVSLPYHELKIADYAMKNFFSGGKILEQMKDEEEEEYVKGRTY